MLRTNSGVFRRKYSVIAILILTIIVSMSVKLFAAPPNYEAKATFYNGYESDYNTTIEYNIVKAYLLTSDVKYVTIKDKKNTFYSKSLDERAKFGLGGVNALYQYHKAYPEIVLKTNKAHMDNWLKYDGRKLPFGMIVNDMTMGIDFSNGYTSLTDHVRTLQYETFIQNMKRGYIDTNEKLISYPENGILYKFLEIYNADESSSKLELYKKIQGTNNLSLSEKHPEQEANFPEYLWEDARRRDFINNLSMEELKALINGLQNGQELSSYTPYNLSTWSREPVIRILQEGIADDSFRANIKRGLTREEFAMLAVKLWEKVNGKAYELPDDYECYFTDIEMSRYKEYIHKAFSLGITNGVAKYYFRPEGKITREEVCKMLVSALAAIENVEGYTADVNDTDISDKSNISDWAREYVAYAYKNNIMQGVGNNRIAPKDNVTAEQTLTLLYRLAVNKGYIN